MRRCGDLRGSADDDGPILSVPLAGAVGGFDDVPTLVGGTRSLRIAARSTDSPDGCSSIDVDFFNDVRDAS